MHMEDKCFLCCAILCPGLFGIRQLNFNQKQAPCTVHVVIGWIGHLFSFPLLTQTDVKAGTCAIISCVHSGFLDVKP